LGFAMRVMMDVRLPWERVVGGMAVTAIIAFL
jgi:hypothetical protein